jgi:hypothetical protein
MKPKRTEADLARAVLTELQRQGYTTYEEVQVWRGGDRADIVAVRGPVVMVVETKQSFSLALLDQCLNWMPEANIVIAACGTARVGEAGWRFCKQNGIGRWLVGFGEISEKVAPAFRRRVSTRLRDALREEQRTGEYARAGSMGGGYWTPFRATVAELTRVAQKQPGIELRDALAEVKHHYASRASALTAIPALIRKGIIEGIRCDVGDGKRLRLYPSAIEPLAPLFADPLVTRATPTQEP